MHALQHPVDATWGRQVAQLLRQEQARDVHVVDLEAYPRGSSRECEQRPQLSCTDSWIADVAPETVAKGTRRDPRECCGSGYFLVISRIPALLLRAEG